MSEQWIERLKHFETPPPATAWDRVEESLEAAPLAGRLQEFSAPPPPALWDRIASELDAPASGTPAAATPLLPARRRRFLPYAAAAAVLGAALLTTTLLVNRDPGGSVARRDHTEVPGTARPASGIPGTDTGAAQTSIASGAGNGGGPSTETPDEDRDESRPSRPERRSRTGALSASIAAVGDRYLVRTHQDGHKVRLSKKVSPVFDCAEHSTGFSWSLCQVSIGVLQEKLAAQPTAVNTDFGGLIDRLMDLEAKNSAR